MASGFHRQSTRADPVIITGLKLRAGKAGKLASRIAGDESTRQDLPED